MRGALALILALSVLAAPASAQKLPAKPPASSATAALLRGAVNGDPAAPPASAPALPALLAPLAASPASSDPARCRLTCASTYYFCIANEASDNCPTNWGQCRVACGASSQSPNPSTLPAV